LLALLLTAACGKVEEATIDGPPTADGGGGGVDGAPLVDANRDGAAPDALIVATCNAGNEGELCGEPVCTPTAECGRFEDTCDEVGEQPVTCMVKRCRAASCTVEVEGATEECTRDTDEDSCGEDLCGACSYDNECITTGSRTCAHQVCQAGACGAGPSFTETAACARATDGTSCEGGTTCTAYDGNCLTDCVEDRTCTDRTCGGGTCNPRDRGERRGCAANSVCGMVICSTCGARFDKICTAVGSCINSESCADLCGP